MNHRMYHVAGVGAPRDQLDYLRPICLLDVRGDHLLPWLRPMSRARADEPANR